MTIAITQSVTLEDIQIEMNGNIVGGAQSAEVKMEQANKPIHEGGTKKPREILDGEMNYSGTLERLFLDKTTITELIDMETGNNPYFDIVGVTVDKNPERKIIVRNAKFKGFSISLALTDETKVSQEFDAMDMDIQ